MRPDDHERETFADRLLRDLSLGDVAWVAAVAILAWVLVTAAFALARLLGFEL